MNCGHCACQMDHGPDLYAANIGQMASDNSNFRTAIWTGCHLQMTLMSIHPCGEIGWEVHEDTDQLIRVDQGKAVVKMERCGERQDFETILCKGDAVFVPAGTCHNVFNTGRNPLKISSVYAPPNHPRGTVHRTKEEAEREE